MLPRVTRWSLLNEPNQPGWLTPQYERRRGRLVATAAVVYRALARAGIAGLKASGHGRDQVLLGETGPIGRFTGPLARRPISPVEFLRKLFCLTPGGRRSKAARLPGVQALRGLRLRAPPLPARRLAAAGRAARGGGRDHDLLAGAAAAGARRGGAGAPDPAPAAGLLHRVRLPDQPARSHLRRARGTPARLPQPVRLDGVPRPARARRRAVQARRRRAAAELPVRAALRRRAPEAGLRGLPAADLGQRARARLRVYGQVRPGANGTPQTVRIQLRPPKGGAFATVRTVTVRSRRGQFLVRVPRRPGVWRLVWGSLVSREARVAPR